MRYVSTQEECQEGPPLLTCGVRDSQERLPGGGDTLGDYEGSHKPNRGWGKGEKRVVLREETRPQVC